MQFLDNTDIFKGDPTKFQNQNKMSINKSYKNKKVIKQFFKKMALKVPVEYLVCCLR